MDVKINPGAWTPNGAGKIPQQKKSGAAAPFSALLRATETAAQSAPAREKTDFSGQTPEEVFARALADRANPDLDSLDDYMEWLIKK